MRTIKFKTALTSLAAFIVVTGCISNTAYGQTWASNQDVKTKSYTQSFKQEKAEINRDLTAINLQQQKVKALKQQCRDERKGGVTTSTTHSNLVRAKADLKRQKAYLRANKEELLVKHQAMVQYRESVVRNERAELRQLYRKLDADLADGKSSAVATTRQIVELKQKLNQSEIALDNAVANMDYDMAVVNREFRDRNGEYASLLPAEGGARGQYVAMK